jgi:hypothetical protein
MSGHPEAAVRATYKRLTLPQRRFVERGCISGDFTMVTVRSLLRKGVFHVPPASPNGRYGFAVLTPLGEQVRDLIKATGAPS